MKAVLESKQPILMTKKIKKTLLKMATSSDAVLASLDKRVQHNFEELRRDLNGEVARFCKLEVNEVIKHFRTDAYGTIKDLVNEGVGPLVKHVNTLEKRCSELEKRINNT